jgi:O-antigen ligase
MMKEVTHDCVAWLKQQNSNYAILYFAYITFFGLAFLTNSVLLPSRLFLWIILPLALAAVLPETFSTVHSIKPNAAWLFAFLRRTIPSLLFWSAALYLLLLAWSTLSQQDVDPGYRHDVFPVSFEILAFLLVTALLLVKRPKFLSSFFTHVGALLSLSALINMAAFARHNPIPASLDSYRLVPFLGMAPEWGSTTISLTYAIYFSGAVATLFETGLSRLQRWILVLSAIVILAGLLWTQARSGYVAVIVALAALVLSFSRKVRLAVGGGMIAGLIAFAATPVGRDILLARGPSERLEVWQRYLPMAAKHPWLGYGQFSAFGAHNIYLTLSDGFVAFHPHNLILSAQIRAGIFAAAAMVVLLIGGLYWGWRYWRVQRSMAPLCIMLTMTVAGMFDYELVAAYWTWFWVTFWLPIGICIGAELAARQKLRASSRSLGPIQSK